jgi:hypothetical protein
MNIDQELQTILESILHPLYSSRKEIVTDENAYIARKAEQIKAAFESEYPLLRLNTDTGQVDTAMTAQEWFNRFKAELKDAAGGYDTDADEPYVWEESALMAAQRAAGINEKETN